MFSDNDSLNSNDSTIYPWPFGGMAQELSTRSIGGRQKMLNFMPQKNAMNFPAIVSFPVCLCGNQLHFPL